MANQTRILIVDDEPDMCWALAKALQPEGYQTVPATTAQEALDLAQEEGLDIALIDVVLPDMDGTELAAVIKKMRPDVIIIVISSCLDRGDKIIEEGLELGTFSGFLGKPFELAEVRRAVKTAFSESGKQTDVSTRS